MKTTDMYADLIEMVLQHYKFGKPPLEAKVLVLQEMVQELCIRIDDLERRSSNDGK